MSLGVKGTVERGKRNRDGRVAAAFHEVKRDEPSVVAATRRKKGPAAAAEQKTAIALSKARAAGANVPEK